MNDFAIRIENLRKRQNLTQMEFVKKLGFTSNTYRNLLETNRFKIPDIQKMSEILEVPITYFFDENNSSIETKKKNDEDLKKIKYLEGLIFLKDDKTKEIIRLFTNIIDLAKFDDEDLLTAKPFLYIFLHIIDTYYKETLTLELKEEIKTIKKKFRL